MNSDPPAPVHNPNFQPMRLGFKVSAGILSALVHECQQVDAASFQPLRINIKDFLVCRKSYSCYAAIHQYRAILLYYMRYSGIICNILVLHTIVLYYVQHCCIICDFGVLYTIFLQYMQRCCITCNTLVFLYYCIICKSVVLYSTFQYYMRQCCIKCSSVVLY